ncbi:PD-(D/E)XK nuclease-like domain-containing protein [Maritalea porphyrae]|uniref:PD-(D/E)XK nuclease-like domain-containing protein n=1 Tax=Maritalea porphyrae TaxID=880732 RepID=UPI0022B065B7|nr:PD-(D/E)XK nuclease-like domain-containing protein [Maritalea porphyrae]MCZ4270769.1 PD-(D/E)XK nuclease-like domain-containing protein [Maritalea porphyrae]
MDKPITIEDGEIVIENGFYDIPIEWYHQQCCDGPSLSSSGLRQILRSPAEFWKHSPLNPDREEQPEKAAFILGRAAHHLLLGEENFREHFVERPAKLDGSNWQSNRTACKEWLAEQKEMGLAVLTPEQVKSIRGMAGLLPWQKNCPNSGLANTPLINETGMLQGQIECSFIWQYDGVWLKARPDNIPLASNDYTDLKTSGVGIGNHKLTSTNAEREYFVQGATVGMGSSAVLGRVMDGFHLVFVQSNEQYATSVKTIEQEDIILGEDMIFVAIGIFKKCLTSNTWPTSTASANDAQNLPLPQWKRDDVRRRLDELRGAYGL